MSIRRLAAATMRQDGDYAAAIRHYEYLTRVEPQNGAAWAELAWLYETTGSAKSLPAAQKAYELLPEALVVLDTYGWIMVTRGVLKDGVAALEEAYRRSPETSSIAYHLAMARQKQGKGAEACTILSSCQSVLGSSLRLFERFGLNWPADSDASALCFSQFRRGWH